MYRKYIENLINWLNDPIRKPLIVWGARQVGKTYLIKDIFAEKYFKNNYVYIDCRTDSDFVNYCHNHIDAKEVLNYISIDKKREIDKNTLLIFDEVQECLPIITLMKYFCQDFREIPIIVTGSMVRIKIKRENNKRGNSKSEFLFPIGKINQLIIYPLDYEEFLYNYNSPLYEFVKNSFNDKKEIDILMHNKIMDSFYKYLLVGGMPEVVDEFIKNESYLKVENILKDLYDNYLGDMELYQASPESIIRSKKVFESIYSQLNKEEKNFKPSLVEQHAKNRDLQNPIDWLTFSYLIYCSSLVKENVTVPLLSNNDSLYRLYLADMGMFTYQSGVNAKEFLLSDGRNMLSGIFFENYVAIELINYGYKLFYWKGKNNAEFEFLIENNGSIIPVYVKKSKGNLNSLEKYENHNKLDYALKVSKNQYGFDENKKILTLPFYYLPFYLKKIKEKEVF